MHWVIVPYLTDWAVTEPALEDCLAQTLPDIRILFVNNGSESIPTRWLHHPQVCYWRHYPSMLSLSATWNRALQFVWETGEDQALVINNDLRIHPCTYRYLVRTVQSTKALFVTATGVTLPQYEDFCRHVVLPVDLVDIPPMPLPGPDFSCFLITKEGHTKYPFDEGYIPAFCEDLSMHREYMLGGDGQKIFGTGLPYFHVGSNTLKSLSAEKREALQRRIEQGSRAYHLRKWGGAANQETYTIPFDPSSTREGVTTPELFERVRNGLEALP